MHFCDEEILSSAGQNLLVKSRADGEVALERHALWLATQALVWT